MVSLLSLLIIIMASRNMSDGTSKSTKFLSTRLNFLRSVNNYSVSHRWIREVCRRGAQHRVCYNHLVSWPARVNGLI